MARANMPAAALRVWCSYSHHVPACEPLSSRAFPAFQHAGLILCSYSLAYVPQKISSVLRTLS
jgi:hypothetical protein